MSEGLATLEARVEEPLLVSSLVNVRYLTGLASSNAVLLVAPDGTRLYTDFRYAERAREVPDVDLVVTRRDIYAELPSLVETPVEFEPAAVDVDRAWAALRRDKKSEAGRVRLVLLETPGKPVRGVELPEDDVRRALGSLVVT